MEGSSMSPAPMPCRRRKRASVANALALDSRSESGKARRDRETHDWNISKKFVASVAIPVVLAGGLNAENVTKAIQTALPVCGRRQFRGFEDPDGSKDLAKVEVFVARAKSI